VPVLQLECPVPALQLEYSSACNPTGVSSDTGAYWIDVIKIKWTRLRVVYTFQWKVSLKPEVWKCVDR
jgi:hypothetical protein